MKRDAIWNEAARVAREEAKAFSFPIRNHPTRYFWLTLPKPWYWVFTFWSSRWKNYGQFEHVNFGEAGYDDAPYEIGIIMHNSAIKRIAPK